MSAGSVRTECAASGIDIVSLTKRFGNFLAVDELSLSVGAGEFVALLGPSGCGKTTTLRMLAGLETPTSGEIRIEGSDVARVGAGSRAVGLVPQDYAVFPHMTVRQNLSFALRLRGEDRGVVEKAVRDIAEILELVGILDARPRSITQSELQRVSIGRTLIARPRFVLFDEPLSNLEAGLRGRMRTELQRLHNDIGCTSVYVTHDQVEAMSLADRIALMKDGHLIQFGTPHDVYHRPADVFVAGFVGSPPMNLMEAEVVGRDGETLAVCGDLKVQVGKRPSLVRERTVTFGVRPEHVILASAGAPQDVKWGATGRVAVVEPLGSETATTVTGTGWSLMALEAGQVLRRVGGEVSVGVVAENVHMFSQDTGERLADALSSGGN